MNVLKKLFGSRVFGKKDVHGFTWLVVCMKTITRGSVTSSDIESVNNINELK